MPLYRDQAIVLRTQKLGEADRIVTLFTRHLGKVRVVGKGVRRTKSRFGARLEPGMMVDVQCYEGRNLDTVTQAETLAPYGDAIARDYTAYTAASAMLETCDRLTEEREPALQQYLLLAGALRSLAERSHDPALVLDAYLLRALAIAGWAPSFHDCARCGAEGPHRAFNLASGGSVCPMCRPPGSAAPAPETLELLAALLAGDWVVADGSDPRHRREGSGLTSAYLQWHLERGIRSLRLVDREPRADVRRSASPAVDFDADAGPAPHPSSAAPAQTGHRA
ncbi:DNA repair protein RecO [Actinomycetota bacterium]